MDLCIQGKIIALWSVFLFGMVFHSQLAMMPLLYGESVEMPAYKGKMPPSHSWLMLGFFSIPMVMIAITVFNDAPLYRMIHLGITAIYSVLNFTHAAMDLMVKPIEWYQIALMVLVFVNGICLNLLAFQWVQAI
ncbi:MAG TPA: hypothetical protein IGS37_13710 [Synechococcales cyanobacterium M55_K2018_004]|nr:hypothetical protein [Synechococcales cyanobacterium M55_K2018_004]